MITNDFSLWEVLMLLCFAFSWPISIAKALRTKVVKGKSPVFMIIIIVGYAFGIINKIVNHYDIVTYLWAFNMILVSIDLFLYYKYMHNE